MLPHSKLPTDAVFRGSFRDLVQEATGPKQKVVHGSLKQSF